MTAVIQNKQTKSKSLTTQEGDIYTKERMLQEEEEREETQALFFEYENLKFCILFTKDCFLSNGLCHLAFHAMSRGFENYTETGYKSNFVHGARDVGVEDVEDFFKLQLNKVGIDLENPKPYILAHVGVVSTIEQPSLF
ncbi:MAG: hypothetical protein L3J43_04955 [Sulfurovum sp.]|nr:hypothetical protein [Sulfurovum sp.]